MFLYLGCRNGDVIRLQKKLIKLGYKIGGADGIFGKATEEAVKAFQRSRRMNADGIVGVQTTLGLDLEASLITGHPPRPGSYDEIYEIFGDPLQAGWWKANGAFCAVPAELNHAFPYNHQRTGVHGFWCHRKMVGPFQAAYKNIVDSGLANELESYDGCHNLRNIRGGDKLSLHSFAIAVDHNALTNPLGAEPRMGCRLVTCFTIEGFTYGGSFKRKDGMHLEWSDGPL